MEIPLTVAAIGAVVAPVLAAVGAIAAHLAHFTLVVERVQPQGPPEQCHTASAHRNQRLSVEGLNVAGYDQDLSRIVEELNRAAPGSRPADKPSSPRPPQNAGSLDQLLAFAVRQNASDLLLIAGTPVALRVNGTLAPAAGPPLSPDDVRRFIVPCSIPANTRSCRRKSRWISASWAKS